MTTGAGAGRLVLARRLQRQRAGVFPRRRRRWNRAGGAMAGAAAATLARAVPDADGRGSGGAGRRGRRSWGSMLPWLRADRVSLSLLYTITNLGDAPGDGPAGGRRGQRVRRLRRRGAAGGGHDDAEPAGRRGGAAGADPADAGARWRPGEVHRGIVREDDFDEAALDLDAIARFGAVPASVLINLSSANPIGLEMVPPQHVRPSLFQVNVRLHRHPAHAPGVPAARARRSPAAGQGRRRGLHAQPARLHAARAAHADAVRRDRAKL